MDGQPKALIQDILTEKSHEQPGLQRTVAFMTDTMIVVTDNDGVLCYLNQGQYKCDFYWDCSDAKRHIMCPVDDGFVWILEDRSNPELETESPTGFVKYNTTTQELVLLPGELLKPHGVALSVFHKHKLFVLSPTNQDFLYCYNMATSLWCQFDMPCTHTQPPVQWHNMESCSSW